MKHTWIKLTLTVSVFLALYACGDFNDDSREGYAISLPVREIVLTSSIDFEPARLEEGAYEIGFNATLSVPLELSVVQGNSGNGFASLTINNRKYCYQGNALDENDPGGSLYFFRYIKTNPLAVCSFQDGGDIAFEQRIDVSSGQTITLTIESPGCSLENGTCVFTEVRAVLDVVESGI